MSGSMGSPRAYARRRARRRLGAGDGRDDHHRLDRTPPSGSPHSPTGFERRDVRCGPVPPRRREAAGWPRAARRRLQQHRRVVQTTAIYDGSPVWPASGPMHVTRWALVSPAPGRPAAGHRRHERQEHRMSSTELYDPSYRPLDAGRGDGRRPLPPHGDRADQRPRAGHRRDTSGTAAPRQSSTTPRRRRGRRPGACERAHSHGDAAPRRAGARHRRPRERDADRRSELYTPTTSLTGHGRSRLPTPPWAPPRRRSSR